jgi:hypothetical protein
MDALCVICGEIIVPYRYYRKEHKICRRPECMKAYRNQRASKGDIRRRKLERAIEEKNGKEMIACAVCGKRFTIIQHTHLKRHGLTVAQYRELYPSAGLMTEEVRKTRAIGSLIQSRYLNYPGKQPDSNLYEFLTGSLLGDGSSTNGATLYTMAFSEEEVIFLSELLVFKFDLANNILKNKQNQFFINFRAAASRQLKEIIASFRIPGMAYKAKL